MVRITSVLLPKRFGEYATQLAPFYEYEAALLSDVDGALEQWPIAGSFIRKRVGADWTAGIRGTPSNFEETPCR